MRYLFLLLISSFLFSCQDKPKNPDFLIGKWQRINEDSSKVTYEIWNKDLTGLGYTLKEKDTVFKEVLNIISSEGKQYFEVTGVNQEPTLFLITELTENSIVCRNNENEFPKEISYWIENEILKAKVANDDFAIDFEFKRIQ
ncbi:hypothetical protein ACOSP6_11905 [Tenacibaculum sp. MEBiC06402]|uniref:hypothetical protein n=1 Tax=unclassified Tenacibaculum TaxID=2635139 RepID=UPI003B9CFF57